MIEKLTPKQEARFPEFIERWTKIGLSTAPADRPKAEASIRAAYRAAGLKEPRAIVWCGSPLSQGFTRAIILDPKFWEGLKLKPQDPVASVGDSVLASVRDSVGDSVRDSVGDSVGDSVWDSVRDSVRDSVNESGYGQHDANWLGFIEFFREVCGLKEQTEKLVPLIEHAQYAGWYLPHANICWVSERPCLLKLDDQGLLHCEDGPALSYPDGWKIYAVHGVHPIPDWVIETPQTITAEKIDKEDNMEVRRIMIERMGHAAYLQETGAEVVDSDFIPIGGGVTGSIHRGLLKDKKGLQFLCGHDGSTERVYYMSVDPKSKTCSQAHKSICGFKEEKIIANA